jgi:hypothetical protein
LRSFFVGRTHGKSFLVRRGKERQRDVAIEAQHRLCGHLQVSVSAKCDPQPRLSVEVLLLVGDSRYSKDVSINQTSPMPTMADIRNSFEE